MDRSAAWRSNAINLSAEQPFRIGGARIDPGSHEAEIDGRRERLQPQNLKVLIALVRRKSEVVTRPELVDSCWDGRIIGEDVINHSISVLRSFAERAGGFSIETVPKAGYRLNEQKSATGAWRIVAAVVALVALIGGSAVLVQNPSRQAEPPMPAVAILPLDGSRDADTRELAVAARDALSHSLAEGGFLVRMLETTPGDGDPPVDLFVSGKIIRDSKSARATIRIEEVTRRFIIYSQQFEASGDDLWVLPERIGAQVAAVLSWTGALMVLDNRNASEPAVKLANLRQISEIVKGGDPLRAYEISRRLAPDAPESAITQLSLAFNTAFALEQLPRGERAAAVAEARHAADRAMALAPEFGDTYALGCQLRSPVRLLDCENRMLAGFRSDADAPFIAFFMSVHFTRVGRLEEALDLARMALANDRYKLWKNARLLQTLETKGHSAEAERLFRQANRWWPNHDILASHLWGGMLARADFGAIERFENRFGPGTIPDERRTHPELLRALRTGDGAIAKRLCLNERTSRPLLCMIGLANVGELDAAFEFATMIYPSLRGRSPAEEDKLWLDTPAVPPLSFLSSPGAAPMRLDPRFLKLADGVGLLAYWQSGRLPDFCKNDAEPVCAQFRRRGKDRPPDG